MTIGNYRQLAEQVGGKGDGRSQRPDWFNHHRLLEPLGYIPPAEAEAQYYQKLARQAGKAA